MCAVSMIMDHYSDKWRKRWVDGESWPPQPSPVPYSPIWPPLTPEDSPEEQDRRLKEFFERLEKDRDKWRELQLPAIAKPEPAITQDELREFRELLKRAREYDRAHKEPNCELEEKKRVVREVAEKLGVSIDFL